MMFVWLSKAFWKLIKPEKVRELESLVRALSPDGRKSWYYYIDFGYGVTVRPELRRDPYSGEKNWCGFLSGHLPDLGGKRILDIGCNAGLYDLRMSEAGAREVVGIDLDVRQAEFVRDWFGREKGRDYSHVRFLAADVTTFDMTCLGQFDLVCMFCVAYHVGFHIDRIMGQVNRIASGVGLQGNLERLRSPKYNQRPHQELAGVEGMTDLLRRHGWTDITVVAPVGFSKPLVIGRQAPR